MPIALENVTYVYSEGTAYEKTALNDISIEFGDGEFIGLIGHTGSGKSTLVQHLNGLMKPTSGRVLFNGEDIWGEKYDRRSLRFHVGLVFQYPEYQLFETTVLADACFGPKNMGLSDEEARRRAAAALKLAGIEEDKFENSPFDLSGGQKRRAAIAGVLAMEPDVLVLDEPTAGLDPEGRDEILFSIKKMREERQMTVILVSHSMEDVAAFVDRLVVMSRAEILYDGAPREIFRHTKELEEIGLSAPKVTYLMQELKKRGLDVDEEAITVEEAKDSILKLFKTKRHDT